jgi:hypothetical protein
MKGLVLTCLALACCGDALADVSGWSVQLTPTNPVALARVQAHISTNQTCLIDRTKTKVTQVGATIFVAITGLDLSCLPTSGESTQDVTIGQFNAGQFNVVVRSFDGFQLTSASFQVSDAHEQDMTLPFADYSDLWWNPHESGWGIGIHRHPSGNMYAAWYTYGADGTPVWFTLQPGQWVYADTYTGVIYRTTGPYFGGAFDPSRFTIAAVGTGTITFNDHSHAIFSYTLEGISSSRNIERMVY